MGLTNERYIHEYIAYNYRMTNVAAAILYAQILDIDHILSLKINIFNYYDELFKDNKQIIKIKTENNTTSALWMYCIIIDNIKFKHFEIYMINKNIQIRNFFMI